MERDPALRRLRIVGGSLAIVAVVLAGMALWLAVDNPAIGRTSRGDHYTCLAPWDTVLNDADNYPGGEPPVDGDQIAARCREAGEHRFDQAVVVAIAAGAVALAAAVVGVILGCRDRRPTPRAGPPAPHGGQEP